jgi:hypothetical protein
MRPSRNKREQLLMTLAEYARHRGCDKKAVQSAIERGRIKHNEDGSIDSDRADLEGKQHSTHTAVAIPNRRALKQSLRLMLDAIPLLILPLIRVAESNREDPMAVA